MRLEVRGERLEVRGVRLIVASLVGLCILPLPAQDTTRVEDFRLPEVEVFVIRDDFGEKDNTVTYCTHEQIESLPITQLSDVLQYLPGLDVRSRGVGAAQTDVSLYGGTFDQVLVCLNGVPVNDAQTGHYAMNIPLTTDLIERIEIRHGTSALHAGSLTGMINIVTRDVYKDRYAMQMAVGSNSDVHPQLSGSWVRAQTHVNASAEYARSDGYYAPTPDTKEQAALENTGYQLANVYAQTRWHTRDWHHRLDVQAGAQYKDAGLGTGYGYASIDQFDATRTLFVSGLYAWEPDNGWQLTVQASHRTNYDRYEWHRGTVSNRHWTHSTRAAFEARYRHHTYGDTYLALEMDDELIRSTNMGEHHRLHTTLHAEHRYDYRGMTACAGIAGHYNTWFGWYGSGYASIGYESLFLTATRSLRMPTWTDLFYHAGVQRGNTALQAEQAWQLALNGQYRWDFQQAGQLDLAGNIFYRWGEDIIDWTYDPADSLFHATNAHRVNTFGLELNAAYHWTRWLPNVSVRYAYNHLSFDTPATMSNYLNSLRHKLVFTVHHGIYVWSKGAVGAVWNLMWQQREGTYVDIYGTPGNPYTPVLLLDGSVYVELPHMRAAFEATNMTNRRYYEHGGILMPGAHLQIRLKWTF